MRALIPRLRINRGMRVPHKRNRLPDPFFSGGDGGGAGDPDDELDRRLTDVILVLHRRPLGPPVPRHAGTPQSPAANAKSPVSRSGAGDHTLPIRGLPLRTLISGSLLCVLLKHCILVLSSLIHRHG
jgi:hypothetical protein